LLRDHVDAYFTKKLYRLGKEIRKKVVEEVTKIPGLIANRKELDQYEFLFPRPMSPPIVVLASLEIDRL
jgi:hypothetical protein